MGPYTVSGGCHCGDVALKLHTVDNPALLEPRLCCCTYCSRQGAKYVSDPGGELTIEIATGAELVRYAFASGTAAFLTCGRCGVYLAAVCEIDGRTLAVVNANVLELALPEPKIANDFDDERESDRLARRARTWTPVRSPGAFADSG